MHFASVNLLLTIVIFTSSHYFLFEVFIYLEDSLFIHLFLTNSLVFFLTKFNVYHYQFILKSCDSISTVRIPLAFIDHPLYSANLKLNLVEIQERLHLQLLTVKIFNTLQAYNTN